MKSLCCFDESDLWLALRNAMLDNSIAFVMRLVYHLQDSV